MSEWISTLLRDVATVTVGHVGPMVDEYRTTGVPFLRSLNVRPHLIDTQDLKYIDEAFHERLQKSALAPGDVVTVRTGKPGQTAVVPEAIPIANCSDLVITRPGPRLNGRWLSYYLNWASDTHINTQLVGAVQQHFNIKSAKQLKLLLPPLVEQRAIAEVLGALDDKIAANAALTSSVDALLSVRYEELMRDCECTELASIATVNERSIRARASGQLRYLDIASVAIGRYDFPHLMSWGDAPGRARRVVRSGDTVWSTVRPNRRSHALVLDQDSDLIASTGLAVITPKKGRFASVYEATRLPEFTAFLESVAEGSAYPAVRGDRFLRAPVPELSDEAQEAFECVAAPLRRRSHSAVVESRFLAGLRDALLPGLMSGRIRVKDAEEIVGEAV